MIEVDKFSTRICRLGARGTSSLSADRQDREILMKSIVLSRRSLARFATSVE